MVEKNEEKGITKSEMVELLSISKGEMVELLNISRGEMVELLSLSKGEMVKLLGATKSEIVDHFNEHRNDTVELLKVTKNEIIQLVSEQFVAVFEQIDSSAETLRTEFKVEIGELRKDMNYRFATVEKRLSSIENNMVFSYEHSALNKRVEKLESMNA